MINHESWENLGRTLICGCNWVSVLESFPLIDWIGYFLIIYFHWKYSKENVIILQLFLFNLISKKPRKVKYDLDLKDFCNLADLCNFVSTLSPSYPIKISKLFVRKSLIYNEGKDTFTTFKNNLVNISQNKSDHIKFRKYFKEISFKLFNNLVSYLIIIF